MMGNEYLFANVGIDSFGFHAPRHYLDIADLATKRNVDPNKFKKGLLLNEMRLPEIDEDVISLGLKAGYNALLRGNINPKEIDAVFVGTETMTYAAKSTSNIFAELLGVSKNSMTQDIYNACAGGTLAVLNAIALVEKGIIKKALVISADISSYELGSPAEPTQGSGAIALIITKNPRVATFSKKFGKISGNVNDFFRRGNDKNAQVYGKYSTETYLNFQLRAYDDLVNNIGTFFADFYAFHAPFAKMATKCMQQIIEKRIMRNINDLIVDSKNDFATKIFRQLDSFMQNISVLPEYVYLKLKEKGYSSETIEKISDWVKLSVKGRVLPQLRVPMNFGNMYNASIWTQIAYILENHATVNDTLYFGSYGSGATCISGLLKVKPEYKKIVKKGPTIKDYINDKTQVSVNDYEAWKKEEIKPKIVLGRILEHKDNGDRGFMLHFCDEGCIIPNLKGLNYCPKGHSGYHTRFFPLYAVLESNQLINVDKIDPNFLKDGYVRIGRNVKKGSILEYEMRRVDIQEKRNSPNDVIGLLNWQPIYVSVENTY